MAYAEAWTYPILGNEDVKVVDHLFFKAHELGDTAVASSDDPPEFAEWLETLQARPSLEAWEDALFAVADHFGLSTDD